MKRVGVVVLFAALLASCGTPLRSLFGEVQGELCNARGAPVAGARVLVDGRRTATDADGHFRAFAVRPGRISVVIGDAPRRLDVIVPEHDIGVVFDAKCRSSDRDAPPFAALGAVPPA